MGDVPLISVLSPVGRTRSTTAAAVQSLLTQTERDIELLLIGHYNVTARLASLPADARIRVPMSKPAAVVLDWHEHPDRLTRIDLRYRREAFIALKAATLCHPASGLGHGRSVWIAGVGRSARRWCDALLAEGATVRGFVDLAGLRMRKLKCHRPVIDYATFAQLPGDPLLISAVTQPQARTATDAWCRTAGRRPWQDYVLGDSDEACR